MPTQKHKKILIAPLDWGMGHTTRCVPIMRFLLGLGHTVVFAGNDWQCSYIEKTFPGLQTRPLDGYNITYSTTGSFLASILSQTPSILKTIKAENKWLQQLAETEHFDAIISDNRYGLYHSTIPSAIITHQLQIQTGMGSLADAVTQKAHYNRLQKFDEVWVPDNAGTPNLSGKLGHSQKLPDDTYYIGLLSQFANSKINDEGNQLLVLLSGPKPQRTMLSDMLWEQMQHHKGKVIFVEGADGVANRDTSLSFGVPARQERSSRGEVSHIQHYGRLTQSELQPLIENASLVISRSGYSTIMDLIALNKKAILIPTPGQTEQEYLAKHLHDQEIYYAAPQKNFNLQKALQAVESFPFKSTGMQESFSQFQIVISRWADKA